MKDKIRDEDKTSSLKHLYNYNNKGGLYNMAELKETNINGPLSLEDTIGGGGKLKILIEK